MQREITAEAGSNIAFIKYWGAVDLDAVVPANRSISMTLDVCRSICSATWFEGGEGDDEILLEQDGSLDVAPPSFSGRIAAHLHRLRLAWGRRGRFRVATRNTFPAEAGIASSASGFTALTLAATRALGVELEADELSEWSRRSGSGSASRSAWGGYVQWPADEFGSDTEPQNDGDSPSAVPAQPFLAADHWLLCDLVAIVESGSKKVSSLDGHRRASTSPYFSRRQELLPARFESVRQAIRERDFEMLADTVDEEGIDMHLITMSSRPPIFYWRPVTLDVLQTVRDLRSDGVPACATLDAGPNVHVICPPEAEQAVAAALMATSGVERVLGDRTGGAPVWREGADL